MYAKPNQPPLGGCVLKLVHQAANQAATAPAAFRRLCVETNPRPLSQCETAPAAFRRLCVETMASTDHSPLSWPAAFRRLCVETDCFASTRACSSPAAFRRLCVETKSSRYPAARLRQPPLGGCVLKHYYQRCQTVV